PDPGPAAGHRGPAPARRAPAPAPPVAARTPRRTADRDLPPPPGLARRARPPAGGMALWVERPEGTTASALAARAAAHGVRVAPGPRFGADGGFEQRLRLAFPQPPPRPADP